MKQVSIISGLLLLGLIVASVVATDYCSPGLCSDGIHIGCNNNGAFSGSCPAGQTTLVPITESLKSRILNSHNSKRNQIASGSVSGFSPAIRMATMSWDTELAQLATLNVKKCVFAHDKCFRTDSYPWSGQNIAQAMWSGFNPVIEDKFLELIDDWWAEYALATQADLNSYPSNPPKQIGHFTVMTAEKNVALGCGGILYPKNGWNTLTITCNYAWTNIIGRPLYRSGTTASSCTTGKNPSYPALCSLSEVYDLKNV